MSSVFQVPVRAQGGTVLQFNVGTGAIVGGSPNQGLMLDATGAVFAVNNGGPAVAYTGGGVPVDINSRVMISLTLAVDTIAPGPLPVASNGGITSGGATAAYNHGVPFAADGKIAAS